MRKSVSEIEEAFAEEISRDRRRRDSLRRTAEQRTRKRHAERRVFSRCGCYGQRVFRLLLTAVLLCLALVATAATVTVVMFRTLYLLLG